MYVCCVWNSTGNVIPQSYGYLRASRRNHTFPRDGIAGTSDLAHRLGPMPPQLLPGCNEMAVSSYHVGRRNDFNNTHATTCVNIPIAGLGLLMSQLKNIILGD